MALLPATAGTTSGQKQPITKKGSLHYSHMTHITLYCAPEPAARLPTHSHLHLRGGEELMQ